MNRSSFYQRGLTACTLIFALAQTPSAALALDAKREAAVEYVAAQEASRAGNPKLALHHALQAWQLDPATPAYVLLVAQLAERAEELEQAERAYAAWLGLAGRDAAGDAAVQQALTRLRNRRQAQKKADEAAQQAATGDHSGAARLYGEARALDPDHLEYLQAEGIQALEAGERERAVALLRQFLERAPQDHPGRLRAQAVVHAGAEPPNPEKPWTMRKRGAVGAAAGAGALLLTGAGFGLGVWSAQSQVESMQSEGRAHSDYRSYELAADSRMVIARNTTIAGVVVAAVAAWLWWGGDGGK